MKKILIIRFSITLLLCPTISFSEDPQSNSAEFESDQPRIQKCFYWDGRIIAQTDYVFFEIDLASKSSTPVYAPGQRRLLSLTTAFGRPYALCAKGDTWRCLFYRSKPNDWDMLDVPEDEEGNKDVYNVIAGNETNLILFGRKGYMVFDGTEWKKHTYSWNFELKPNIGNTDNLDAELLRNFKEFYPDNGAVFSFWKGKFYYSYDRGEFGGGLYRLDLTTGEWSDAVTNESICHVRDLFITQENQLMIVQGYSHLGLTYFGELSTLTEQGLTPELSIKNRKSADSQWPYNPKLFIAVKFNKKNEPILLTPRHGLLVRQGASWEQLTPFWSKSFYPTSLLVLNENQYLVGTYDHGVILIDLKEQSETAIRLATSFYDWLETKSNQHVDLTPDGAGHM